MTFPALAPSEGARYLRTFGSLRGVLEASDPKLLEVEGITPRLVAALREKLGGEGAFAEGAGKGASRTSGP